MTAREGVLLVCFFLPFGLLGGRGLCRGPVVYVEVLVMTQQRNDKMEKEF